MLVVLHHDGDNYGGGSERYYHCNFQNMVNWAAGDPDYDVTTIQDYLDRFPRGGRRRDPRRERLLGRGGQRRSRVQEVAGRPGRRRLEPRPQQLGRADRGQEPRLHRRRHGARASDLAERAATARARHSSGPGTTCWRPRPATTGTGTAPKSGTSNVTRAATWRRPQADQVHRRPRRPRDDRPDGLSAAADDPTTPAGRSGAPHRAVRLRGLDLRATTSAG